MPNFLEQALAAGAAKKGLTGRRADNYIFGALNNMGAYKGNVQTAKGKALQRKHDANLRARTMGLNAMRAQ